MMADDDRRWMTRMNMDIFLRLSEEGCVCVLVGWESSVVDDTIRQPRFSACLDLIFILSFVTSVGPRL